MKILGLILLLADACFGAKTTVTDTIYATNGATCFGSFAITYPSFYNTDNQLIAAGRIDVQVSNGVFSVQLEPGNYYTVNYVLGPQCTPNGEFWNVPTSATPVNLAAVRTLNPPSPGQTLIALSSLAQTAATNGECILWSSSMGIWVPGACGSGGTGVSSVFGRTGAVTAQTGDYTAAQVTNAVDSTSTYANPSWITSLAAAKVTGGCAVAGSTGVVQKTNGSGCAASSITDNGTTVVTTEPVNAPSFNGTDTTHSAGELFSGTTSGGVALVVADVAGTAISYILPSTNGMAGQYLIDSGSTTCPTLAAGMPSTCHLLQWVGGGTTVGSLGTCDSSVVGVRKFVTDANATTFLSTVAAGGSNKVPVVCNGTNWIIG